jgi:hypothetical protein
MIKMKGMVIITAMTTEIEDHDQDTSRFAVRGVSFKGTAQFHK